MRYHHDHLRRRLQPEQDRCGSSGGAVFIGFQFANSYNTIAGLGIPEAIDGTLDVAQTGRTFRATLHADKYPSWEFLRIPHYTTNAMNSILFFGGRR